MSPAAQLLMRGRQTYHQGKRKQRKPPLKKNGWVSQRFKPFPLELPSIFAEREKKTGKPEQHPSLTFDDLKKIRDKASKWTKNFNLRSKISKVNNFLCWESLVESSQPEPVFFFFCAFQASMSRTWWARMRVRERRLVLRPLIAFASCILSLVCKWEKQKACSEREERWCRGESSCL